MVYAGRRRLPDEMCCGCADMAPSRGGWDQAQRAPAQAMQAPQQPAYSAAPLMHQAPASPAPAVRVRDGACGLWLAALWLRWSRRRVM